MVGGGDPFYLKFWVNRPRWSEIADDEPIISRSTSASTPNEKSSITLIGSPYALDHRTLPLSSLQGGSKTQNGHFSSKNVLRLKKSLLQSFFV